MHKNLLQKGLRLRQAGFTLVELLIVIALISILSVAVLATINPIEQANKAKDSTVQNDAAEVMNAYERYYANNSSSSTGAYPWLGWLATNTYTVETALILDSTQAGFGICYANRNDANIGADTVGVCNYSGTELGLLIAGDELKPSFAGKAEFQSLGTNGENKLWLYKAAGSGGSVYVCYIPKAKSNRQQVDKLYCLDQANATMTEHGVGTCTAPAQTGSDAWGDPDTALAATDQTDAAIFRCVPE